MPSSPKRVSHWRAKAEEIKRRRAMIPLKNVNHLSPNVRDMFERFYSNAEGKLFGARATPFSTAHAGAVFLYELSPQTFHERFIGEGIVLYDREKSAIVVQLAKKDNSLVHTTPERTRIRQMRGIQLFRAILDYALIAAKKNGVERIVLRCNPKLMVYYSKFGFKISERIYAHENSSTIEAYEMELPVR